MTTRRNALEFPWPHVQDFLCDLGADRILRPGGTLLAHLGRVARALAEWGAGPDVAVAGLTHAVYGTDGFDESLLGLDERARLCELIGERPEELVYLFAACDRSAVYSQLGEDHRPVLFRDRFTGGEHTLTEDNLRALMEITAAHELDLVQHDKDHARHKGPGLARLFTRSRAWLSTPANTACTRLLGPCAADETPGLRVSALDHLVLTVADEERTIAFYSRVLGMEPVTFGDGRRALTFGTSKINLHTAGRELLPHAARPTPGSADLCLVTRQTQSRVLDHLAACRVAVEQGPVPRTGALGPVTSTYLRDPDGNLIEISTYSQPSDSDG
ncbi:VOC family protein [Streptomyces sp. NPDC087512]|uniref:VOC family protein n=1 Tax=unclassified Streptomyces TaxID=2593676 RepID=UPI0034371371